MVVSTNYSGRVPFVLCVDLTRVIGCDARLCPAVELFRS